MRINKIQTSGAAGTSGDWVELINTGTAATDICGFVLEHGNITSTKYIVPAGTTPIAPNGFLVLTGDKFKFDLGSVDSVQSLGTDGSTVDSYTWGAQPLTSYGRCPDATGSFVTTMAVTEGAANSCLSNVIQAEAWPGGSSVATASNYAFGQNLSGLAYEGSETAMPGVLWGVDNGPSTLYRLIWNGAL